MDFIMTDIELTNFIMDKLIVQGKKSTDEYGSLCMYRSPTGLKCAVGHLIKDEDYLPEFENCGCSTKDMSTLASISKLEPTSKLEKLLVGYGYDVDVLVHFQFIHDAFGPDEWPQKKQHIIDSLNSGKTLRQHFGLDK